MNGRIFILFTLIVLVVFASGCSGGGKTETDVQSTDMLEIVDLTAIPAATVKPSGLITIRMEVKNTGQEDVFMLVDKDARSGSNFDGDMLLVNYCKGLYELEGEFQVVSKSGRVCDEPEIQVELSGMTMPSPCYLKFLPGQTHIFQWKIRAPDESTIRKLVNECNFNFQTIYTGEAKTVTYAYFVSPLELEQRIYTKNDLTLTGNNIASYGPVSVNFETGEPQPIRAGDNDTWTVYLNLKNLGSGIAKISDIRLSIADASGRIVAQGENCEFLSVESDDGSPFYTQKSVIDRYLGVDGKSGFYLKNIDKCNEILADDPNKDDKCGDEMNCKYLESYPGSDDWVFDSDSDYKEDCAYLEMLKSKLEIFKTKSARVGCTLHVPKPETDFFIMTPYKFVSTAHYSYSLGKDLKIKTDPSP